VRRRPGRRSGAGVDSHRRGGRRDIADDRAGDRHVRRDESSEVTPSVPGQVIATPVNIGDMVNPGDVLVRRTIAMPASSSGRQASLQQAEAQAAGRPRRSAMQTWSMKG
jgi:multidrug efflux pump subunit AcrA (membrane-fusion protein)